MKNLKNSVELLQGETTNATELYSLADTNEALGNPYSRDRDLLKSLETRHNKGFYFVKGKLDGKGHTTTFVTEYGFGVLKKKHDAATISHNEKVDEVVAERLAYGSDEKTTLKIGAEIEILQAEQVKFLEAKLMELCGDDLDKYFEITDQGRAIRSGE